MLHRLLLLSSVLPLFLLQGCDWLFQPGSTGTVPYTDPHTYPQSQGAGDSSAVRSSLDSMVALMENAAVQLPASLGKDQTSNQSASSLKAMRSIIEPGSLPPVKSLSIWSFYQALDRNLFLQLTTFLKERMKDQLLFDGVVHELGFATTTASPLLRGKDLGKMVWFNDTGGSKHVLWVLRIGDYAGFGESAASGILVEVVFSPDPDHAGSSLIEMYLGDSSANEDLLAAFPEFQSPISYHAWAHFSEATGRLLYFFGEVNGFYGLEVIEQVPDSPVNQFSYYSENRMMMNPQEQITGINRFALWGDDVKGGQLWRWVSSKAGVQAVNQLSFSFYNDQGDLVLHRVGGDDTSYSVSPGWSYWGVNIHDAAPTSAPTEVYVRKDGDFLYSLNGYDFASLGAGDQLPSICWRLNDAAWTPGDVVYVPDEAVAIGAETLLACRPDIVVPPTEDYFGVSYYLVDWRPFRHMQLTESGARIASADLATGGTQYWIDRDNDEELDAQWTGGPGSVFERVLNVASLPCFVHDPASPNADADGFVSGNSLVLWGTVVPPSLQSAYPVKETVDEITPKLFAVYEQNVSTDVDALYALLASHAFQFDPTLLKGQVRWTYQAAGSVESGPAVGADGTVYVGSSDRALVALRADGTVLWEFSTQGPVRSSPAIDGEGNIHVGTADGILHAVKPDGTLLWSLTATGPIMSGPAIGADGIVYACSTDGWLFAVDRSGSRKWALAVSGAQSSPVIDEQGTVYVGSKDGTLHAVNPDGTEKWMFAAGGAIEGGCAVDLNATVYFLAGANLVAVRSDGIQRWRASLPCATPIPTTPVIGSSNFVTVGTPDGRLFTFRPDGTQEWSYQPSTPSSFPASPVIGSDGCIYFVTDSTSIGTSVRLVALGSDGARKWEAELHKPGPPVSFSTPCLAADGTLYAGAPGSLLLAVVTGNGGPASSDWPMPQANPDHSGRYTPRSSP